MTEVDGMSQLNEVERMILDDILADHATEFPELAKLLEGVEVEQRENTGSGFFTSLRVLPSEIRFTGKSPIGLRDYAMEGVAEPIGALLFMSDGRPNLIDCHFFGTDTTEIAFDKVKFRPWKEPPQTSTPK
jgi:hypothetical protein